MIYWFKRNGRRSRKTREFDGFRKMVRAERRNAMTLGHHENDDNPGHTLCGKRIPRGHMIAPNTNVKPCAKCRPRHEAISKLERSLTGL